MLKRLATGIALHIYPEKAAHAMEPKNGVNARNLHGQILK